MSSFIPSQRENRLLFLAGYLVIGAVFFVTWEQAETAWDKAVTVLTLGAFAIVLIKVPPEEAPVRIGNLYLGAQTVLTLVLMALGPFWVAGTMLFFVLSAQVMLLVPERLGLLWLSGYALVTVGFSVYHAGYPDGLYSMAMYAGAYFFFGLFSRALVRADEARRESQRLLAELQEAHTQLQEYSARVEELAVVEERSRVAREMHDTLGHRLTVASVQLEGARLVCLKNPEEAAAIVDTVRDQVRESLRELRQVVATMRAPLETDLSLRNALRRLVEDFERGTGIAVHRNLPELIPDLPGTHRVALYRAAQEGLTNVQRHARAQQVWLTLMIQDGRSTLVLSDDGVGFSAGEGNGTRFGLRGLQERAAQLGGELVLEARPGGGAQLHISLPLPEPSSNG